MNSTTGTHGNHRHSSDDEDPPVWFFIAVFVVGVLATYGLLNLVAVAISRACSG